MLSPLGLSCEKPSTSPECVQQGSNPEQWPLRCLALHSQQQPKRHLFTAGAVPAASSEVGGVHLGLPAGAPTRPAGPSILQSSLLWQRHQTKTMSPFNSVEKYEDLALSTYFQDQRKKILTKSRSIFGSKAILLIIFGSC